MKFNFKDSYRLIYLNSLRLTTCMLDLSFKLNIISQNQTSIFLFSQQNQLNLKQENSIILLRLQQETNKTLVYASQEFFFLILSLKKVNKVRRKLFLKKCGKFFIKYQKFVNKKILHTLTSKRDGDRAESKKKIFLINF